LQAVRSHVRPGSFALLLLSTGVLYVINGLASESLAGSALAQLGRVAVLLAGVYVLSANRLALWLGLLMAGLIFTFQAQLWPIDPRVGRVLQDSIAMTFLAWLLFVVLREVFRPTTTERDAVIGALCGFMLILTAFMRLHGLLEAWSPGSYHVDGPPLSERSDAAVVATFQYFSTITVTTVGFGDIVPVAPGARIATGLEAISGQLYLAIVIATLVGRVVARAP
jgi:hypothetical protein